MNILVVIVSYRVTDLTVDCLHSVAKIIDEVPDTKVAVCENGTGPEHAERLRQVVKDNGWGDWARVTALELNLGFTGGNNAVIRPALQDEDGPRYVLLLNSDTLVHAGAFRELYDFLESHPDVGVAGSRLENRDGSARQSLFRFYSARSQLDDALRLGAVSKLLSKSRVIEPITTEAKPVDWLAGASMLIRREVIDDIGLLDEDYYTYFDDIDFCLRAKKAGWPTWYIPTSRVIHLAGQTTGITGTPKPQKRRPQYWFDARRRFFLKHHGKLGAAACDAAYILGFTLWRIRRAIQRKPDHDPQKFLIDFIRNSVFCRGFKLNVVPNPALKDQS